MIKTAINRPITTLMIFLSLVVFGIYSLKTMNVNLYPQVNIPIVKITTYANGDMNYIKTKITQKIEDEVSSIEGIKKLYSTSFDNLSVVSIEFELNKDLESATNDVRDKMQKARLNANYEIEKLNGLSSSVFSLFITRLDGNETKIMQEIDDVAKPFLERISGVSKVKTNGFLEPAAKILLDRFKLDKNALSANEVANLIKVENLKAPLGKIENEQIQMAIKSNFSAKSIDEIRNLTIKQGVFLKDIASVDLAYKDANEAAIMDKKSGVLLGLELAPDANALTVIALAKSKLDQFKSLLGSEYDVKIAYDKSEVIQKHIDQTAFDMILGILLTIVIVYLFLRNFSITIISVVAIPTSIVATFFIINALGYDINRLSLIALTLGIGIFIDDAIVVTENIASKLKDEPNALKASFAGIKEIAFSVFAISLVLLCVFVPIAFMSGIVGKYFNSFAMSVAAGIVISFFVSIFLVPTLSARFVDAKESGFFLKSEPFFEALENFYEKILALALKFKLIFLAITLAVVVCSFALAKFVGGDFMPSEDNSEFNIYFKLDPSLSLQASKERLKDKISLINADPQVAYAYFILGYTDAKQPYLVKAYVRLKELKDRASNERQNAIMQRFRDKLKSDDMSVIVADLPVVEGGDVQPVKLTITSENGKELEKFVPKISKMLKEINDATDVNSPEEDLLKRVQISIDEDKAKRLNLDKASVASAVYSAFSQNEVSVFENENGKEYELYMRLDDKFRSDTNDILKTKIRSNEGFFVTLGDVATISFEQKPASISRFNRADEIKFLANTKNNAPLNSVANEISKKLNEILPANFKYKFLGFVELMDDTNASFIFTVSASAVLIYMVLAALYESFLLPFLIMLAMPLAFCGVVIGLFISGNPFSLFVMVGVILLFGMVGKNAILVVDFANHFANSGMEANEAVKMAAKKRLRAVLMTTFAMIFAMLPLALGRGAGFEANSPMAISIIFGLISSTLLSLLVVPVLFAWVYNLDKFIRKFYERERI
ncbi:efflux RND transporter permease subunit [Campylobacter concisus]|uniref:efflux RND transporter permease subunit n=1 Tax=Campylobacter concisus TaxID=199 RepID=UPI000CD9D8E0|nr:efflux RND transporter permease subunit [Campylobacter concisus]QPH88239.1 efflux RND transporter permease subunit [Campylobacter concisus]QPI03185.1 efflux RND transporter permease subunit [Campylobacter concisus]